MKVYIRDFFWAALVVALAYGWWLDHSRLRKQLDRVLYTWPKPQWKNTPLGSP